LDNLYVYMSVIRPISTVAGNAICLWLICKYSHGKQLQCWELNYFIVIFWVWLGLGKVIIRI